MKLEIAHGATDLAANTWQGYNILPLNFGAQYAAGYWIDFPQIAISSNYLYISVNIRTTTTNTFTAGGILRISLDELKNHSDPLTVENFVSTDFTYGLVSGATDTMYFATNKPRTSSGIRQSVGVFSWPESSTTVSEFDLTGLNPTYDPAPSFSCQAVLAGVNPCEHADTRIITGWVNATEVGFAWGSGQNAAAGHTYPFTRVLILSAQNLTTVISQPDIWNASYAYLYLTVATNARGHLGGTIDALGGSQGSSSVLTTYTGSSATTSPREPGR